jgi:hypothetical protein
MGANLSLRHAVRPPGFVGYRSSQGFAYRAVTHAAMRVIRVTWLFKFMIGVNSIHRWTVARTTQPHKMASCSGR